ncbi:MAG: metalloregulator ArsR/SmtB family transcription factor [Anaerolineaceae bacterium]|nr:metalloregulator ArsR/SmtB family transcription factor [Anaerolineaceae bacterium]
MDEIEELTDVFKALSDPTRLKLVRLLSVKEDTSCSDKVHKGEISLCVNALAHNLGVSQSAVSQHLRVLRQVGLVKSERRGNSVHYMLDRDSLRQHTSRFQKTMGDDFVIVK